MTLPLPLVNAVKNGKAVLFVGSGGLYGASLPNKDIPLGNGLRDLLNETFLGGEFTEENLQHVSDLAISQHSLATVQDFIKDYFAELAPADFHLKIPKFKWRAIFTTNYDRLIELCYEQAVDSIQTPSVVLTNLEKKDEASTTNDIVQLIKLHGCVTRTRDNDLPLILTVEQYNESLLKDRTRLFEFLYELAFDNAIIFVGHSLQDANIRSVMNKVLEQCPQGQRHYLVKPDPKDAEVQFWAERKITTVACTFEQMLLSLDGDISQNEKELSLVRPVSSHSIVSRFSTHAKPSGRLLRFLTDAVEYSGTELSYEPASPEVFYKGASASWYGVAEGLAVRRKLQDRIEKAIIDRPDADRKSPLEMFTVKGEAGSGKTILLRQLVWDARDRGIGIFLWVKPRATVDMDCVLEIARNTQERVFLVWDNAATYARDIEAFYKQAKQSQAKITILTSERFNEWNVSCEGLDNLIDGVFKLTNLVTTEIEGLIELLEKHGCLGPNLEMRTPKERVDQFSIVANSQLLVALYEANSGRSFEEIIFDEYTSISPEAAKEIYLTICTMNRLRVPVRAGLISRIHNVGFEEFQRKFFKPLEMIVTTESRADTDVHYVTRHPEIAEIVFVHALKDPDDKFNEYIRIISKINISFESDRLTFRKLIRARSLIELFRSHDEINSIYTKAISLVGDDAYLLQQRANYERIRDNGSYDVALELLERACKIAPFDSSILHSLAVLWRAKASDETSLDKRKKYRGEAASYLRRIVDKWGSSSFVSCTLIELSLDDLSDLTDSDSATDRSIDELIRKTEQLLIESKRKYPSDEKIYQVESRFAKLLDDDSRALSALKKSFTENNRDPFIASRLASALAVRGKPEEAIDLLDSAIRRKANDQRLHFQIAELRRTTNNGSVPLLIYHYKRSYVRGDQNYQAQFWHARFLFESEDVEQNSESKEIFNGLRTAPIGFDTKTRIRDHIFQDGVKKSCYGSLKLKRHTFGFVAVDGSGDEIFVSSSAFVDDLWDALNSGDRLRFTIGFAFTGAVCDAVEPV